MRESTFSHSHEMPCIACFMRFLPSKANGLVTTPTVRAPISLAIFAKTGAAPVPVPPAALTNAISWSGTGREFSTVGGPAVGGALLTVFDSESVYLTQAVCSVVAVACFAAIRVPPPTPMERTGASGWRTTLEGLRFVWREKIIPTLGVVLIDLARHRSDGKICGYAGGDFGQLANFPVSSHCSVLNRTEYPL